MSRPQVLASVLASFSLLAVRAATGAEGSDSCGGALNYGSAHATHTDSTVDATIDGACSCSGPSRDRWYRLHPDVDCILYAHTCLSGTNYDTVLSLHTGCPGDVSNEIACNDNCPPGGPCPATNRSYLAVPLSADTNYWLRVGGANGAAGTYALRIDMHPYNDDCAGAFPIPLGQGLLLPVYGATMQTDAESSCTGTETYDIWYRYDATADGILAVDNCSSPFNRSRISAYKACPPIQENEITCNEQCGGRPCWGEDACVFAPVYAGETCYVRFLSNTSADTLWANASFTPAAADACEEATSVGEGAFLAALGGATSDGASSCSNASPDAWFSFTAPRSGNLRVDTCATGFTTALSLHAQCPGTLANELNCSAFCLRCSHIDGAACVLAPVEAGSTTLIRVAAVGPDVGSVMVNVRLQPPIPVNDDCLNAIALVAGDNPGTLHGATVDGAGGTCVPDIAPDVWYIYEAPSNGLLKIDTCGVDFWSALTVHTGCPGVPQNAIACANRCYGEPSGHPCQEIAGACINLPVYAGETYYVRVAGSTWSIGDYVLHANLFPAPANDDCDDAINIGEETVLGDATYATNDGSGGCGGTGRDLWYRFVAPFSSTFEIVGCGPEFAVKPAIYDHCGGSVLACSNGCPTPPCPSLQKCLSYPVIEGAAYLIRIVANGPFAFTARMAPPANDDCANATNVSAGLVLGDTRLASVDGASVCDQADPGPDIWYRLVPPLNGTLSLDLCESTFDTTLSVHIACPGTAENTIACNDDCSQFGCVDAAQSCLKFPVAAGMPYFIRVGGKGGESGAVRLTIGIAPTNDDCVNAAPLVLGANSVVIGQGAPDGESSCGAPMHDAWYRYAADDDGTLLLDTCRSQNQDVLMSVHSGCPGTIENELACNQDCAGGPCAGLAACASVPVTRGATYYVRVASATSGLTPVKLRARFVPLPSDLCADAPRAEMGAQFGSVAAALPDGSSSCDPAGENPDVWFLLVPYRGGTLRLDTCGSSFDTLVSIHDACPGSSNNELICGGDCASGPCPGEDAACLNLSVARCGHYFIRIASADGAPGNFVLNLSGAGGCAADLDGSGVVTREDLGILLAEYGCQQNCSGDTDCDGDTDQADLGVLLSEYGKPCGP